MYEQGYNAVQENKISTEPAMQELVKIFEKELAGYNELLLKIKSQLQNIYRWDVPGASNGSAKSIEKGDAIGHLQEMIKTFSDYNQRLVDISNHLSRIV